MIAYKSTRPDGTDFRTGTVAYRVGEVVEVNTPGGVKAYEILKVEWK